MALNTPTHGSLSPPSSSSPQAQQTIPLPSTLEQTLRTLTSHRSVLGYLLIARSGFGGVGSGGVATTSPSIIRSSGVIFEGDKGRKYASVIARIVESVQAGLDEVVNSGSGSGAENGVGTSAAPGVDDSTETDQVRFMRIRTKRHEIMISPDERYLLAVLHDPTVT